MPFLYKGVCKVNLNMSNNNMKLNHDEFPESGQSIYSDVESATCIEMDLN